MILRQKQIEIEKHPESYTYVVLLGKCYSRLWSFGECVTGPALDLTAEGLRCVFEALKEKWNGIWRKSHYHEWLIYFSTGILCSTDIIRRARECTQWWVKYFNQTQAQQHTIYNNSSESFVWRRKLKEFVHRLLDLHKRLHSHCCSALGWDIYSNLINDDENESRVN